MQSKNKNKTVVDGVLVVLIFLYFFKNWKTLVGSSKLVPDPLVKSDSPCGCGCGGPIPVHPLLDIGNGVVILPPPPSGNGVVILPPPVGGGLGDPIDPSGGGHPTDPLGGGDGHGHPKIVIVPVNCGDHYLSDADGNCVPDPSYK